MRLIEATTWLGSTALFAASPAERHTHHGPAHHEPPDDYLTWADMYFADLLHAS